MKCFKCQEDFPEKMISESHDIPKYIGGTDKDGRHWLCERHHKQYDGEILIACLKLIGEELVDDSEIPMWMKELSKCDEKLKELFREEAKKIRDKFFGVDDGRLFH